MHTRDMPTKRFPYGHYVNFTQKQRDFILERSKTLNKPISAIIRMYVVFEMNRQLPPRRRYYRVEG